MALVSISGVGKTRKKASVKKAVAQKKASVKKAVAQKKASVKKAVAQKKAKLKVKVQAKKKIILAQIKKVGKIAIKYNPLVATARNSFLLIVSLNVFNLAKRLNILLVKNPKKLMDFWIKLSGNFSALQQAINKGKNKKPIIGEVITVASSVATATPILVKVLKFLEENGISKEDIVKAIKPVIAKALDKKITEVAEKQVAKEEKKQTFAENKNQTSNDEPIEEPEDDNSQIGYYY